MPEIKQSLGFNASQAINTLASLDGIMKSFKASVSSTVRALGSFNAKADITSGVLKRLATDSEEAFTQLQKVATLQGKISTTGTRTTGRAPVTPQKAPDLTAEIAKLQELYQLPSKFTQVQGRAYQSAITEAAGFLSKHKKTAASLTDINRNLKANFQGLENTLANHLAKIKKTVSAPIKPPKADVSKYASAIQKLIPLTKNATEAQRRAWKSVSTSIAETAVKGGKSIKEMTSVYGKLGQTLTGVDNKIANSLQRMRTLTGQKVVLSPLDISKYVSALKTLSPLTEKSTTAQKRAWQSLATKTAEVAAKSGMSVRQMMAINGKLGQSLTGPANTIANNMQKMSKSGQDTAKKWTVSWETIARVVATQAIVRALSAIRNALSGAVKGAIDFQRTVAEIGTIAGGLGGLERIEDMVLRVSQTFNVDLADATEAAYQTVSNQIASTEKDVESFLGSAAKFAKITKTDMTTAVNLLSGTLNAFGKEVSETEDVAAKSLNSITLGRTRAEELVHGMGTINPIAGKLGISIEELSAAEAP